MRTRTTVGLVIGAVGLSTAMVTIAQTERPQDREVSPFQRRVAPGVSTSGENAPLLLQGGNSGIARFPQEFRTIDGVGNNPLDPEAGAAGTPFVRKVPSAYGGDGSGDVPARLDGPSARAVSNAMCAQLADMPNDMDVSDYLWQWGQFLDHDIAETPLLDPSEAFDIDIPFGDPAFDPFETGLQKMGMDRSAYFTVDGKREQVNLITAFIDASNVYGSEEDRAHALRANDGTGRLLVDEDNLLPLNKFELPNAGGTDSSLFLAGDVRSNEQVGLTAMHTLFVREHNYWADWMRSRFPGLSGDDVYERARAIVAAEMQAITYNEFLPLLLGENGLAPYGGYKADVEPGITNTFATAGYRVGHTMLSGRLMRLDSSMQEASEGHIALRDAFFSPAEIQDNGITSVLRGLSGQRSQIIDQIVVDDIRDFLFGPPGAGGFDLASLNMQRGRDHGLGSYNDVREAYGRSRAKSFDEITPNADVADALRDVYDDNIDMVDPWVGLLSEPHVEGAMVGETLHRVLADQFESLRDGDRFWYKGYLPRWMSRMVDRQTLGVIIRRNTQASSELSQNVFVVASAVDADWNNDGNVNVRDILAYLRDYRAGNGDVDGDGDTDIEDLFAFLDAWGAAV